MRSAYIFSVLVAALTVFCAPTRSPVPNFNSQMRELPVKPRPCQPRTPAPSTTTDTEALFQKFANAFIVDKNITEAFEFVSEAYVNHHPGSANGFDSAWNILSPFWGNQDIEVLGMTFSNPQGWLKYNSSFGTIVDRYRWENGCIVEHWDVGESFPSDTKKVSAAVSKISESTSGSSPVSAQSSGSILSSGSGSGHSVEVVQT